MNVLNNKLQLKGRQTQLIIELYKKLIRLYTYIITLYTSRISCVWLPFNCNLSYSIRTTGCPLLKLKVLRLSALGTGQLHPSRDKLVRGWVEPRAIGRREGSCHCIIPVTLKKRRIFSILYWLCSMINYITEPKRRTFWIIFLTIFFTCFE